MRPISYQIATAFAETCTSRFGFLRLRDTAVKYADSRGLRLPWSEQYLADDASSELSLN